MLKDGKIYLSVTPQKKWGLREGVVTTMMAAFIITGVAVPVFSYVAFAICAILLLLSNVERAFCLTFFLIPFAAVFKFSVASASCFTYIEIILILKIVLQNRYNLSKRFVSIFLVFVLYVVAGSDLQVTTIIKQLMIPLLLYGFFCRQKLEMKQILLYFAYGLLLSSIIAQFMDQIPNMTRYIVLDPAYEISRSVNRMSGLYSDPNYYSLALIMTISGLLILYINNQMGILSLLLVVIFSVFGAGTVSKSFILMFGVTLICFDILLFAHKRYAAGSVFLVVIFALLITIFSGRIEIFNNIVKRLQANTSNLMEVTTGRSIGWGIYLESIFEGNVLVTIFGRGIAADYPRGAIAAHNTYLDFLYYYGFAGSLVFMATCSAAIPKQKRGRRSALNFYLWGIVLIMSFFLSCLKYYDFVFMLILAICNFREEYQIQGDKEKSI